MKNISLITIVCTSFLFSGCVSKPEWAAASDYIDLSYVVDLDEIDKDAIYEGTKMWIAENFRSASHVIDLESRENGVIICNGSISDIRRPTDSWLFPYASMKATFKMKVEVKENRMRLTFFSYQIVGGFVGGGWYNDERSKMFKAEIEQLKEQLAKFGDEIKTYLQTRQKTSDF